MYKSGKNNEEKRPASAKAVVTIVKSRYNRVRPRSHLHPRMQYSDVKFALS